MARKSQRKFGGKTFDATNFMIADWSVKRKTAALRKRGYNVRKTPGPKYKDGSGRWWHIWVREK